MKKVSVIIVNFNTSEILEDCLKNLKDKYQNMEVIVVDNGSSDNSVTVVKEKFPKITLIESLNNGLAAGSNLGLNSSSGDYLLYLGSDAFPHEDTISGMVEFMEDHKEVGISTCKLLLRSGKVDMDCRRGFPTPWAALTHFAGLDRIFSKSKVFNQYFIGYRDLNTPHEIDLCISHFMLIRKEVFVSVGKWDESYFVFGEDVDFCYRVKKAGWKIMYLPQWVATHYKGAGVGIRKETVDVSKASPETRERMKKLTTEAMKLFYEKHYKDVYPLYVRKIVYLGIWFLEKIRK